MGEPIRIQARGNRVYLLVPADDPSPLGGVVKKVREALPGVEPDWVAVREAYRYGRGRWFPVASRDPSADQDQKAKIRFSPDELTAYLVLYRAKGRGNPLGEDAAVDLAHAYGVPEALLDRSIVRRALTRRMPDEPEPVARGRAAVNGTPARAEWHTGVPTDPVGFLWAVEQFEEFPQTILAEVERGATVGVRHPPGQGNPGLSAAGRPLAAHPGTDPIVMGPDLSVAPDGRTVVAQADGHLKLAGRGACQAVVVPLLHVGSGQDLDEHAGAPISGSVVVDGDLEYPRPLRILGDLEVRGSLIRTPVEVTGSLIVHDGIIQYRGTPVRAGGILSAAFLERTRVAAHTVHIRRYALKSTVQALDAVHAPTAELRGGSVTACREIRAGELGTPNALVTEASVGVSQTASGFLDLYRAWAEELRTPIDGSSAPDPEWVEEAARWEAEAKTIHMPEPTDTRILAGRIHPGVTVRMGTAQRKLDNPIGAVELLFERIGPRGRVALTRR